MCCCIVAGSGLTALHLAAIKGSVAVVRALVRAGASLDALTLSGVLNPNLSRGSTALHIAAARGHAACVSALMESQASIPGTALGYFLVLLGGQTRPVIAFPLQDSVAEHVLSASKYFRTACSQEKVIHGLSWSVDRS